MRVIPSRRVLCLVACVALAACAGEQAPSATAIEPSELASRISTGSAPVILDVRTPEEFAAGHIPGAVNVPVDQLGEQLASLKLGQGDEIVVHCERGGRAASAESVLRSSGYTNVRDLTGHMQKWRDGKHPVE